MESARQWLTLQDLYISLTAILNPQGNRYASLDSQWFSRQMVLLMTIYSPLVVPGKCLHDLQRFLHIIIIERLEAERVHERRPAAVGLDDFPLLGLKWGLLSCW